VKPYDVEDMRRKLRAYLDDPGSFAHIGIRAKESARKFASEEFAAKLLAIAARVSGSPAGAAKETALETRTE